jgi:hypothetical protein
LHGSIFNVQRQTSYIEDESGASRRHGGFTRGDLLLALIECGLALIKLLLFSGSAGTFAATVEVTVNGALDGIDWLPTDEAPRATPTTTAAGGDAESHISTHHLPPLHVSAYFSAGHCTTCPQEFSPQGAIIAGWPHRCAVNKQIRRLEDRISHQTTRVHDLNMHDLNCHAYHAGFAGVVFAGRGAARQHLQRRRQATGDDHGAEP